MLKHCSNKNRRLFDRTGWQFYQIYIKADMPVKKNKADKVRFTSVIVD
jgi:hypothetical protein